MAAKGEHAKAADILRKALELNPAHPSARRDLAMVCQQTGDFEAAKDHLIEVLRLNPSDEWAPVILANHYAAGMVETGNLTRAWRSGKTIPRFLPRGETPARGFCAS